MVNNFLGFPKVYDWSPTLTITTQKPINICCNKRLKQVSKAYLIFGGKHDLSNDLKLSITYNNIIFLSTYLPISAHGGPSAQTAAFLNLCNVDAEGGSDLMGFGGDKISFVLFLKTPNCCATTMAIIIRTIIAAKRTNFFFKPNLKTKYIWNSLRI